MDRVTKVPRMALKNGTTRMRTHVDLDTIGKLKPLEGVLAAKILGLKGYGLEVGNTADVVILDAQTPAEALRLLPDRLYVIKSGKVLSRTWTQTEMAF